MSALPKNFSSEILQIFFPKVPSRIDLRIGFATSLLPVRALCCRLDCMTFLAQTLEISWVVCSTTMQRHDVIALQANDAAAVAALDLDGLVLLGLARPRTTTRARGIDHADGLA
jgi:hypothetical protein